ncbi:LuxR family transcriptional regulator [Photobacterium gaetbulicola]|uniref:LuxR family transcriptional regulator n=1 Tax=Photobacterium gaetbulicola TaxID=1295392 RepID=A0A0B9H3K6_9GAMM|nr:response regulator transcription factor [Photobacterium gaetbulicola]KHT63472.1 LuxR family transcriptional regulator [Photobacterium gaetbulicola]
MDKLRLFELSNQLRSPKSSDAIHAWFGELQNEIDFEFSILGLFDGEHTQSPVCYGFSPTQFASCFNKKAAESDPLIAALRQSNHSIMTLMDSHTHPDYGKRLLLAGYHGNQKAIYLTSFGDRHPSREEIDALYLLTPHLYMASSYVSERNVQVPSPSNINLLTTREYELMPWLKLGKSNWEISRLLNISERTVKYHLQNIYSKLDVHNRTHAVSKAIELGWYED